MDKLSERMQQMQQMPAGPPVTGIEAWWADKLIAFANDVKQLEAENKRLREGIQDAMNNIGVPQDGYPAPVAEAYRILDALKESNND